VTDLAIRAACLALATYAIIGQIVKPGLRLAIKLKEKRSRLTARQEEALRWATRTLCVVVGALLGTLPLWPAELSEWWGVLIGAASGSVAPALHGVASKALPERLGRMISGGSLRGD